MLLKSSSAPLCPDPLVQRCLLSLRALSWTQDSPGVGSCSSRAAACRQGPPALLLSSVTNRSWFWRQASRRRPILFPALAALLGGLEGWPGRRAVHYRPLDVIASSVQCCMTQQKRINLPLFYDMFQYITVNERISPCSAPKRITAPSVKCWHASIKRKSSALRSSALHAIVK